MSLKTSACSFRSGDSGTLWINQDLFTKYGLKPPTTLDEWDKVCQDLEAKDQGCFVQGAAGAGFDQDTLQAIANSVEPGLWTRASKGEATWDDPGIIKTLEIWKQLFDRGIMQEGAVGYQQYPDANNDFLTGKYAMVMMGTWYTQYATEKAMTAALKAAGVSGAKPFPIVPIQFPDVAERGFWMHNTPSPLDIIYIDPRGRIVSIAKNAERPSLRVDARGNAEGLIYTTEKSLEEYGHVLTPEDAEDIALVGRLTERIRLRIQEELDDRQLLEVLFIVGSYLCLALVFNSVGLELDADMDPGAAPDLIKPNSEELGQLCGRDGLALEQAAENGDWGPVLEAAQKAKGCQTRARPRQTSPTTISPSQVRNAIRPIFRLPA